MFIVYPHEWRELASASATCAHRTIAQTTASPESPAVHRSLERRGPGGIGEGRCRSRCGKGHKTEWEGGRKKQGEQLIMQN